MCEKKILSLFFLHIFRIIFLLFCVTIDFSTFRDFLLDCAVAIFLFQCVLSLPCASQCDVRDGRKCEHSKGVKSARLTSLRCLIVCVRHWWCGGVQIISLKFLEKPFFPKLCLNHRRIYRFYFLSLSLTYLLTSFVTSFYTLKAFLKSAIYFPLLRVIYFVREFFLNKFFIGNFWDIL